MQDIDLYDEANQWALRKAEKDIIYLVRVGLVKLEEVPEILRTKDVCLESCLIDIDQAKYIPDHILPEMSEYIQEHAEEQKSFENTKSNEEKIKEAHCEHEANERYYRETTGDYDHDGDVDADDKKIERNGDQFIDL